MKRLLLLLGAAALLVAAPALAQRVYLDVDGDGICGPDAVTDATTSVDVWFDTTFDGGTCNIFSYEFILRSTGNVTFGAYTNMMGTFTTPFGVASGGNDYHNGFGGTSPLAAGAYKVGSLAITVAPGATPVLTLESNTSLNASFFTAFGSECFGNDFDNTIKLGSDFVASCGTAPSTPVRATTWGAIKNIYR